MTRHRSLIYHQAAAAHIREHVSCTKFCFSASFRRYVLSKPLFYISQRCQVAINPGSVDFCSTILACTITLCHEAPKATSESMIQSSSLKQLLSNLILLFIQPFFLFHLSNSFVLYQGDVSCRLAERFIFKSTELPVSGGKKKTNATSRLVGMLLS